MPVYMIRAGETGPVKLGYSIAPAQRLADLQVAHYERLRIIRLFEGGEPEEASLHIRFIDLHILGEWHSFSRLMLGDVGLVEIPPKEIPEPTPVAIAEPLLRRVEAFLTATDTSPTIFGLLAVNDGKFVGRLRSGANMTLATIQRVDKYLSDPANAVETGWSDQHAPDLFAAAP